MNKSFSRTIGLFGESGMQKLKHSSVIIFGVGGVGSYAAGSNSKSRDRAHNCCRQ